MSLVLLLSCEDPTRGSPPSAARPPATKLNDKVLKVIEGITKMDDPQVALFLLRQINNDSLIHMPGTVCLEATKAVTTLMHDKVRDALASILRTISLVEWKNTSTCLSALGTASPPLADIAKPAFEASHLQCTLRLRSGNEARFFIPKFHRRLYGTLPQAPERSL